METQHTDAQTPQYSVTQTTTVADIEAMLAIMLQYIGEDPQREGLRETPARIVRSWNELFCGYHQSPSDLLTTFENGDGTASTYDEMVMLKNIEFTSFCEHHWLPFTGTISIGYLPDARLIGISKLARLAEMFARRLQVQERLTDQIADTLMDLLQPRGAMVVCQARHLCMTARGVQKQHSEMITSAVRGTFLTDKQLKQEFLACITIQG